MSADYRTASYKAYLHHKDAPPYIHVVHALGEEYPAGDFSLADIAELVQLAGLAWAGCPGVEVRYVIEAARNDNETKRWALAWSAPAKDVGDGGSDGVDEEYALATCAGMSAYRPSVLVYRLVRRTVVTSDEILEKP